MIRKNDRIKARRLLAIIAIAAGIFATSGCGVKTVGHYSVQTDADNFTEETSGRVVSLTNWVLHVDGKEIAIPHAKSAITVYRNGKHVKIDVNGKTVLED